MFVRSGPILPPREPTVQACRLFKLSRSLFHSGAPPWVIAQPF
jgi:hypothetical protein